MTDKFLYTKLQYNIKENKKQIGTVYVVGCPVFGCPVFGCPTKEFEKLDNYGDEGYKFYEILTAAYPNADTFEFVKIVDDVSEESLIIPWNLVSWNI